MFMHHTDHAVVFLKRDSEIGFCFLKLLLEVR